MNYFVIKQKVCEHCTPWKKAKNETEAVGILQLDEYEWAIKKGFDRAFLRFRTLEEKDSPIAYQFVFVYNLVFNSTTTSYNSLFPRILTTKTQLITPGKDYHMLDLEEITEAQFETYQSFGIEEFETIEKRDIALEFITDNS